MTHPSTSTSTSPSASIGITNLLITLPHGLGLSAFSLPAQPCTILLSLTCHLKPACLRPSDTNGGLRDDWDALGIGKSVNYSALGKTLGAVLGDPDADAEIASLAGIARRAAEVAARAGDYAHSLERIDVTVVRPKAVLFADSVSVERRFRVRVVPPEQGAAAADADAELEEESHALVIRDIRVDAVIGLHPHEREEQQRLVVDVELDMRGVPRALVEDRLGFDYKAFGKLAYEVSFSLSAPDPAYGPGRVVPLQIIIQDDRSTRLPRCTRTTPTDPRTAVPPTGSTAFDRYLPGERQRQPHATDQETIRHRLGRPSGVHHHPMPCGL